MLQSVQIRCKNNKKTIKIPFGSTLLEAYRQLNLSMPYGPVSARVNNRVEGLNFRLFNNKDVEFLDITSSSGMRTYTRSLFFVLAKATEDVFPGGELRVNASVSGGYYCNLLIGRPLNDEDVRNIRHRMQEIVDADLPFRRVQSPTEEAVDMFRKQGLESKVLLLESTGDIYTYYYRLGDSVDYFYGSLLTSTGGLKVFDLVLYEEGLLLRAPSRKDPRQLEEMVHQKKMLEIYREDHRWQDILGVRTVGDFNVACRNGRVTDLVNASEALQEKKISHISDEIRSRPQVRMVLISGPSSSGKTTFSKRLSIQLMAGGVRPYPISLDDYFVNREDTPRDEKGDYDFESIHALDIDFFNEQLNALLAGEEIELPRYDFQLGKRVSSGRRLRFTKDMVLILEGIHALNPALTTHIPEENKYKIYVSALTTILLDDHNYIPTTDNRLLRRIIRDHKYRGYSALETIRRWPSVRAGEAKWIFPYQENADVMFNSALLFELAVIRTQVLPLLEQVPECEPEYAEAYRLRTFLRYLVPVHDAQIPPTSLLREFLGGSSFTY